jgi:3'(2'), 5'-bisphosphate nucleotidase
LAATLASEAGRLLRDLRASAANVGPDALGQRGDKESNAFLLEQLGLLRPHDAVLSEEAADDLARLTAPRVWIVDPLDGTREFQEPPRVDWAVHVALWSGDHLAAAAVALPGEGITFSTLSPPVPTAPSPGRSRKLVVSRSRPPAVAAVAAASIGAEVVTLGSAGAKAMAVVRGDVDAYVHTGGQYEWDSAAPVGVAVAAGFHTSRVDGSPLIYNQADPWLPDLLICRPELAERLLEALAAPSS